jgi:hypothetical protein
MILYFGKTQGQTSCVMGSLEPVLRYMEEREQVAGLTKNKPALVFPNPATLPTEVPSSTKIYANRHWAID